jgi:glutamyl-tRNA synthetase
MTGLMAEVRVRFSPAPTGSLHVGSARTALFNWLYARHVGGTYILRIEDTDVSRSTQAAIDQAIDILVWLGFDQDEGPHFQSANRERHLDAARQLLATGAAYECFCTKDELDARAEAAKAAGRPPGYDGTCRDLTDDERAAHRAEGRSAALRFKVPREGRSTFDDVVRGTVSVEWATISDFVIVRADGTPVFYLANAVDDIDHRITHVIRGEDLLDTTHRVLAIRRALGVAEQPVYAHCPLILGPGGHKLSKRHGAVSIEDYRDQGYLADALVNYLARLGWGTADGDEVMTRAQLIEAFDIVHINPSPAGFDAQKLEWMNGEHIRRLPLHELVEAVRPFAVARYGARLDGEVFTRAVAIAQERATTLVQIAEQMDFLFVAASEFEIADESWTKLATTERVAEILDAVTGHVEQASWTLEGIDPRPTIEALGIKPRKAMPALYAAIEGRHAGLPLFDSIELLGRERAVARLRAARERLAV